MAAPARTRYNGGADGDRFQFKSIADFRRCAGTRDQVADFKRAEGDKLDFSFIDADTILAGNQAFVVRRHRRLIQHDAGDRSHRLVPHTLFGRNGDTYMSSSKRRRRGCGYDHPAQGASASVDADFIL